MFLDKIEFLEEDIINAISFFEKFLDAEIMDPILNRMITPKSLAMYMDIMKICLNIEPNERPTMGDVEAEYNSWNNKEKKKKIYPFQMFLSQRFQF